MSVEAEASYSGDKMSAPRSCIHTLARQVIHAPSQLSVYSKRASLITDTCTGLILVAWRVLNLAENSQPSQEQQTQPHHHHRAKEVEGVLGGALRQEGVKDVPLLRPVTHG